MYHAVTSIDRSQIRVSMAFASVRGHRADSELAIGIKFTLRTMTPDSFLSLDSHTLIMHSLTFLKRVHTTLARSATVRLDKGNVLQAI